MNGYAHPSALVINPPVVVSCEFTDYPVFANCGALRFAAALRYAGLDVTVRDSFALHGSHIKDGPQSSFIAGASATDIIYGVAPDSPGAVFVCLSVFHRPYAKTWLLSDFFDKLRAFSGHRKLVAVDVWDATTLHVPVDDESFLQNYPQVDELVHECGDWIHSALAAGGYHSIAPNICGTPQFADAPLPDYSMIDVDAWFGFMKEFETATGRVPEFSPIMPALPVSISRGCPWACAFCAGSDSSGEKTFRALAPDFIASLIVSLKNAFGLSGIIITDCCPNGSRPAFDALLDACEANSLRVYFTNGLRADRLEKKDIARLATLAPSIAISCESASDRVRNGIIGKHLEIDSILHVAEWCQQYSLPLSIHYMIGVPGETIVEMNDTMAFAMELLNRYGAVPNIQRCVTLPGTGLHRQTRQSDSIPADGDLSPLFAAHGNDTVRALLTNFRKRLASSNPEKIIVNLTYRCTNRCTICAVGDRPQIDADTDAVIAAMTAHADRGVRLLDIDGGEPTLHPGLFAIVAAARRLGYEQITITSNGSQLASRAYASRLLLSGVSNILISIYSHDASIHDSITRTTESHDKTVASIKNIIRLRPSRVSCGINTVMTESNYTQLPELCSFLVHLGVKSLNVQFPTPFGAITDLQFPPLADAISVVESTMAAFTDSMDFNIINLPPCLMPRDFAEKGMDTDKYSRVMIFVNQPEMVLADYLASTRTRNDDCSSCHFAILCEGHYRHPASHDLEHKHR